MSLPPPPHALLFSVFNLDFEIFFFVSSGLSFTPINNDLPSFFNTLCPLSHAPRVIVFHFNNCLLTSLFRLSFYTTGSVIMASFEISFFFLFGVITFHLSKFLLSLEKDEELAPSLTLSPSTFTFPWPSCDKILRELASWPALKARCIAGEKKSGNKKYK